MEFTLTEAERVFRDKVRAVLKNELTPEIVKVEKNTTTSLGNNETAMVRQAMLYKRGWVGAAWPSEFGGPGWTSNQRYIFNRKGAFERIMAT